MSLYHEFSFTNAKNNRIRFIGNGRLNYKALAENVVLVPPQSKESHAEEMIRDMIIRGAPDKEFRNNALQLGNLMLDKVLELTQTFEASSATGKQLETLADIGAVHTYSSSRTLMVQQHFCTGDDMNVKAVQ